MRCKQIFDERLGQSVSQVLSVCTPWILYKGDHFATYVVEPVEINDPLERGGGGRRDSRGEMREAKIERREGRGARRGERGGRERREGRVER